MRNIVFTHNENWLVTSDALGQVKYWKLNLELVKVLPAPDRILTIYKRYQDSVWVVPTGPFCNSLVACAAQFAGQ